MSEPETTWETAHADEAGDTAAQRESGPRGEPTPAGGAVLSAVDVALLQKRHEEAHWPSGSECAGCSQAWPCDVVRLAAALAALTAERDRVLAERNVAIVQAHDARAALAAAEAERDAARADAAYCADERDRALAERDRAHPSQAALRRERDAHRLRADGYAKLCAAYRVGGGPKSNRLADSALTMIDKAEERLKRMGADHV